MIVILKVIVKYEKTGFAKYLAHLELVGLIERILRRVDLPLEYSSGYNPKPQIAFAAPLSVGLSSVGEYFEVKVTEEFDLNRITKIDKSFLPIGMNFTKAIYSTDKKSIMAIVHDASYILKVETLKQYDEDDIRNQMKNFLNQDEIMWTKIRRKKKPITKNIVELINNVLILNANDKKIIFKVNVRTGSTGNLQPDIIIRKFIEFANLELEDDYIEIERLDIFKEENNEQVPII
ncbi:MAG: TIGR03936 family radical SAM-associated protein [Bacillota bacterium]|nr:TIGR03936 family radical SAM-associated protein [Bacillota bacterium]